MESGNYKIIFLITLISVIFAACNNDARHEPYRLKDGDKALLMSGDIILRRGHGMLSSVIVRSLNDTLGVSHCGVIVRKGDSLDVVHCLADEISGTDGIQKCSIDEFTDESVPGTVSVVRLNDCSGNFLANGAVRYLKMGKRFDWNLDDADTTKFFCSELPVRIMKDSLGIDTSDDADCRNFTQFFNPRYFKVILRNK